MSQNRDGMQYAAATIVAKIKSGRALLDAGRAEEALAAFEDGEARFARFTHDDPLRALAASSASCRVLALRDLGRVDEAIAVADALMAQFVGDPSIGVRRAAAACLIGKISILRAQGLSSDQVFAIDKVVRLLSDDPSPAIRETAASALVLKAFALRNQLRLDEALVSFEGLLDMRWPDPTRKTIEHLAQAASGRVLLLGEMGRRRELIDACDAVIRQFGAYEAVEVQEWVDRARRTLDQLLDLIADPTHSLWEVEP